jgi:hypothetical protein
MATRVTPARTDAHTSSTVSQPVIIIVVVIIMSIIIIIIITIIIISCFMRLTYIASRTCPSPPPRAPGR